VIETKWDGFEDAFLHFQPAKLTFQPEDYWEGLLRDARIVRNGAKIMSVRDNAAFVQEIAKEHGSFGKFLAKWPSSDEIGLLDLMTKRGSRLGGNTGQMLLRFLGWDGFVTSGDVVACLRDAGLDIAEQVKSKGDLAKVQAQFNAWAGETGLPYTYLSRICALSVGENRSDSNSQQVEKSNGKSLLGCNLSCDQEPRCDGCLRRRVAPGHRSGGWPRDRARDAGSRLRARPDGARRSHRVRQCRERQGGV
jgi:3-methyladenine DNA glycosylase Tag